MQTGQAIKPKQIKWSVKKEWPKDKWTQKDKRITDSWLIANTSTKAQGQKKKKKENNTTKILGEICCQKNTYKIKSNLTER